MKAIKAVVAAVTLLALALPAGAAEEVVMSDNVKPAGRVKYVGGTELASDGKYLLTGQMNGETNRGQDKTLGGMRIVGTTPKTMKLASYLNCPGNDNDVEVVKPGLAVMGFATNQCAPAAGTGLVTIDYKNPKKPRIIGMLNTNKNHTLRPVPGTDYIWTAGGGLSGGPNAGPAIVDVSNPSKPELVKVHNTLTTDCHDLSFWMSKDRETRLAFCSGAIGTGEVQILDAIDPLNPVLLSRIVNPVIQYSHWALANHDGTLLAIDDEAFAAHECHTGQSPTGRVWIYDISNPSMPIPQGSHASQRGGRATGGIGNYVGWVDSWCLSHGLDWHPKKNLLGVTWFTGGWSVLDVTDPLQPKEAAYYMAEDSATYSVLWHRGNLYTNDMHRGAEGFQIKGL